jgi:tetratricopeptide (TPR) repeat protein
LLNLTSVPRSPSSRVAAILLALPILAAFLCPPARAADKKDKDKDKEEKKEKLEPWTEVRTSHFVVASDGGEKTARRIADQFELVCRVFQSTMPNARVNTGIPIQIMASHDAKSFARLFPEYPSNDKRRAQPNGMFIAGPVKTYIVVRTNVSGPAPYEDIYQNYARMVLRLSYRNLPPWLEEGYSNVYGSLSFTDRGARIARTDPDDLSILFESPLLPLDLVMRADRGSPYASAGDKRTVYYAESRALVHFLLTDPQIAGSKALDRYVDQVEHGTDSLQAARQAFGDLTQLQSRLDTYIKAVSSPPSDIGVTGGGESASSPRTLSAPQTEARIGDFEAARGRRDDGQSKLEEALMMEPTIAEAEQSLGFLLLKENQLDDADGHFAKAVQLDPNDGLTYYGQGLAAMSRGGFVGVPVAAVTAFEKSIALIPDYAPAWYNLASIYGSRTETLQKALTDAQRAAALAPGDSGYQLQVAAILERLGRNDDARKAASQALSSAGDRKTADKAGDLIARTSPPPPTPAPAPTPKPASSGGLRIERKTEPEDKPSTTVPPASRTEPPPSPPPAAASTHVYSMIGSITDVNCTFSPQVTITLKAQTLTMHLHADDLAKVSFQSPGAAGAGTSGKNTTCAALRGRSARVSYTLASGKSWDGEIQIVEFRAGL